LTTQPFCAISII